MKKVFLFLLMGLMMISFASAVWWNPFTWGDTNGVVKEASWVEVYSDNPDMEVLITDRMKHDADIYLCSKTLTNKKDLKDLDFATGEKVNGKNLDTKNKLKSLVYNGRACYYYKPTKEERFLKFDKHSTHLVFTNESITYYEDDEAQGKLSLITDDYEYKNGKPNIKVGFGKQLLTHTFYLENYTDEAITNLRVIDMNTEEEVERNINIKFLTYETEEVDTYSCSGEPSADQNCSVNGTKEIQIEKWNDMTLAVTGENYILGIFSDVVNGDYLDADFDYYGVSVLESPIDWTTWESDLLTDIYSWWKFDETTGTVAYDEVGNINLTNTGPANINETTSIIGTSYEYRTIDYLSKANIGTSLGGTNDFTYCSWLRPSAAQGFNSPTGYFFMLGDSVNPSRALSFDDSSNQIKYRGADGSPGASAASAWTSGTWYYICGRYSGTNMEVLKNGVSLFNTSDSTSISANPDLILGWTSTDYIYSGFMDEGGLWNRELSNEEILALYNSTQDGCSYNNDTCFSSATNPSVVLNAPINNYNSTTRLITFNTTVTDEIKVDNVTLYINGAANQTNTSGINGTYTWSIPVGLGVGNWSVLAWNNQSLSNQSSTRTFNISGVYPNVVLTSPDDNANLTSYQIDLVSSVTDNEGISNVTLFVDGILNETDTSEDNGTYTFTKYFSEGIHNWSVLGCDNDGLCNQSETRTFNYTQPPLFVELLSPDNLQEFSTTLINVSCRSFEEDGVTQVNLTINGVLNKTVTNTTVGENLTLEQVANFEDGTYIWGCSGTNEIVTTTSPNRTFYVDSTSPSVNISYPTATTYTEPVTTMDYNVVETNQDKCWYTTDNGVTNSSPVSSGTNFTGLSATEGSNTWITYCNDTFGNEGSDSITFTLDSFTIDLIAPTDDSTIYQSSTEFSCSGLIISGNYLNNVSLYTNSSGSWAISNTTELVGGSVDWQNLTEVSIPSGDTDYHLVKTIDVDGYVSNVTNEIRKTSSASYTIYNKLIYYYTNGSTIEVLESRTSGDTAWEAKSYDNANPEDKIDYIQIWLRNGVSGSSGAAEKNTRVYSSFVNSTTENFTKSITGDILWNCEYCDSSGMCEFSDANYTVLVDREAPTVVVESPPTTLSTETPGEAIDLNVTFTDLGLEECWYNYNGTNISIDGCLTGVKNSTTFILEVDNTNILLYANDTFGNLLVYNKTWTYLVGTFNVTYTTPIYEGSTNTIIGTITPEESAIITSAILNYNGTNYTTSLDYTEGSYIISYTFTDQTVLADTNYSFFFYLILGGDAYTSSSNVQTVLNTNFGKCGVVSDDKILTMNLVDEVTEENLTGDIQINAELVSSSTGATVQTVNLSYDNLTSGSICLSPVSSYSSYYLDAEIRYVSDGYSPELYHLQNAEVIANNTLTLYDLNESEATIFKVTYQDSTFNFVENAILQLQRKYISEGVFKTVEAPLTSNDGVSLFHIDLDSIKYRVTVTKDGVVLDEFDNLVFKCQSELTGECDMKLLGDINPDNEQTIETIKDFYYSEPSVSDGAVSVSFSIPSGSASNVNVVLEQKDQFGNETLCNKTILSSAGSVSCNFSEALGESYIDFSIYKDGQSIAKKSYIIHPEEYLDWLGNNYIFILVLLFSLVGMALTSPEWIIVNGIITMVISGGLYLARGLDFVVGLGAIAWLVIAGIILITKISKQEDR